MVYLLLGSNIAPREQYLQQALQEIEQKIGQVVSISSIYQTQAWGNQQQADFLNRAVAVETQLDAFELLALLQTIEKKLGRKREQIWGARTIDIDIIFYDQQIISTQELTIPHSRILERRFVLQPLTEIAPNFEHPVWLLSIKKMLEMCDDTLTCTKI
jgi:2-amino-4-hydroxy-6-hydroxymethyldihydropteridine diphosphokinase